MKRFLLSMLTVVSIFLLNIPAYAVYQRENEAGKPEFAPGQILVKFRPDTSQAAIGEINGRQKAEIKKTIKGIDVHVIRFSADIPVEEMVGRYNADVSVEYAEPDYIATATATPNDPRFTAQWGLNNTGQTGGKVDADIDAPQGWEKNTGSSAVKIAVVDTGIYGGHEDITGKVVAGYNAIDGTSNATDDNGHGTHVSGSAAANTNNSIGIAGVCWGCALMPVKVLDKDGSGTYSDVSEGIMWAADHEANAINLSLGGSFSSATLLNAVNYAWNKGVLLACAAGNSGGGGKLYPAYYDKCVAVAATDNNDKKAYFSTFGKWVDVAAPGVGIISTVPGGYASWSGTSMATPHVSGLAGLLYSTGVTDSNNDGKINDEIRAKIETSCDKITGTGRYWAKGRINICTALGGTNCDSLLATKNEAKGMIVETK